jgi:hypothetical protein
VTVGLFKLESEESVEIRFCEGGHTHYVQILQFLLDLFHLALQWVLFVTCLQLIGQILQQEVLPHSFLTSEVLEVGCVLDKSYDVNKC